MCVFANMKRANGDSMVFQQDLNQEMHTMVEVIVDKEVRETCQRERGKPHGGATKKREISRTSLSTNLHF